MIEASVLTRAIAEKEYAERCVKTEMPNADFLFIGIDEKYIFFNICAKMSEITKMQKINIIEKTRFIKVEDLFPKCNGLYGYKMKMKIRG